MVAPAAPNIESGAPGTKTERLVLAVISQLLDELESPAGKEALRRKGPDAHLEKDLGLGSLERVELLVRLDSAFQIELPDRVLADADTIRTLITAVTAAATAAPGAQLTTDTGT